MTHEVVRGVNIDGREFNVDKRGRIVGAPDEQRGFATIAEAEAAAKRRSASFDILSNPQLLSEIEDSPLSAIQRGLVPRTENMPFHTEDVGQSLVPQGGAQAVSRDGVEQNVGAWKKFLQRLRQDPALQQTLLMTGANLFRTPGFGQSQRDVFANAVGGGVNFLSGQRATAGRQQLGQQAIAQRETASKRQATTATSIAGARSAQAIAQAEAATTQRGEIAGAREAAERRREGSAQRRHEQAMARLDAAAGRLNDTDFDIIDKATKGLDARHDLSDLTPREKLIDRAAIGNRALTQSGRAIRPIPFTKAEVAGAVAAMERNPAAGEALFLKLQEAFGPEFKTQVEVARASGPDPLAPGAPPPASAAEAQQRATARSAAIEERRTRDTAAAAFDAEIDEAETLSGVRRVFERKQGFQPVPTEEEKERARDIISGLDFSKLSEEQRRRVQEIANALF